MSVIAFETVKQMSFAIWDAFNMYNSFNPLKFISIICELQRQEYTQEIIRWNEMKINNSM